jgi:UDP-glucose 4-epimerase
MGFSKLCVERMLADLNATRGLGSIALHYFNATDVDPNGGIDEARDPDPPVLIRNADHAGAIMDWRPTLSELHISLKMLGIG